MSPTQLVHPTLEWPVIALRHKAAPDGILPDVMPLLRVVRCIPDAMVPAARLKPPFRKAVLPAQFPFPVGDPRLDIETQVVRRAEAMQVIRHQQVIADQPGSGFPPGLVK